MLTYVNPDLDRQLNVLAQNTAKHLPTSSSPFLPFMTRQNLATSTSSSLQFEGSHSQYG